MTPVLFSDPEAWQRLHVGPLSPYIDAFAQDLLDQGYAPCTVISKLRVAAKLSRWLAHHRLGVEALAEQPIERFLHELHQRERRTHHGDPTTLRVLLEQVRRSGILPAPGPTADESERTRLEQAFARYLREERGLGAATVRLYLPVVRHFLAVRFGQNPLALERLCARDVTRFVLPHAPRLKPTSGMRMSATPIGIAPLPRSCYGWRHSVSSRPRRRRPYHEHQRYRGPLAAGVFHRAPHAPAPGQSPHPRQLS